MYRVSKIIEANNTFPVVFRCEHCGKVNCFMFSIKNERSVSMRESLWGQSLESREYQAAQESRRANEELIERIYKDAEKKDYTVAKMRCTCSACNKTPTWAKSYSPVLAVLFDLFIIITVFAFVFSLLYVSELVFQEYITLWGYPILGLLAISYIFKIIAFVRKKIISYKTRKMDDRYLPIFCRTVTEAQEKIKLMEL